MSSAPWWFVLVSVIVTGVFTLAGSLLTGMLALRRQREELAHAKLLEREKELYNRRVDFHLDLVPTVEGMMKVLPSGWVTPDFDTLKVSRTQLEELQAFLAKLQNMRLKADVVSGKAVRGLLEAVTRGLEEFLYVHDLASFREVVSAANHLLWEMRIELGVTTRDDAEEFEARERYGPEE
ncbi:MULTISPECIES: hypothetical protein [unclassified Amycolatopsis]|uniref:hypothetical protein n=1 Tax=unclassified Amycolatopsis TaxID=2618356 RepID=UPI002875A7BE|nr:MULTISPECIES: hypothetical protein [unclassified Amycolatopsis]MDS0134739.1 hypothetical protein [Amycolatopsis sp. 505]MDS0148085.1 hypothetical protein [Amycolatopsis sp. CM201R]